MWPDSKVTVTTPKMITLQHVLNCLENFASANNFALSKKKPDLILLSMHSLI